MEKTFSLKREDIVGVASCGHVLRHEKVDHLVGRLLTIVDAVGLDEKQEKSVKDLIKNEVYSTAREGWIVPELAEVLHQFMWWSKGLDSGSLPHDSLSGEYTLTFKQEEAE